ncbi:MAG TPA: SPOR domain-containing protein [Burkholderiales bacterium]|nr:SPOR domain-containing protein [Burkholderiales bacterium]
MRTLFLVLLFANLAFFAWARYLSPADAAADAAPLSRQIDPEKLRILGAGDPPPAAPKPAPAAATSPAGPAVQACLEWGSFTLADAPRAQKMLEPLSLGARVGQRRTEETAGWWVYIPSQGTRQNALKKAAELKSLGVEEYFVVADEGPFRWGVSLGVFRTEEAALSRLATLRRLGVKTAEIGARETTVPKVWLQVQAVDAGIESQLREVAKQIDGSELRTCPEKS